jgi:hypothetical protein
MSSGIAVLIAAFMVPSAMCLYYAWRACAKLRMDSNKEEWRERSLIVAVLLASLSQLLVTAFLIQGYHLEGQSYATRVSLPWLVVNLTSLLSWLIAFFLVILGKGGVRRPLLIWCFVMPMTSCFIFMSGYTY